MEDKIIKVIQVKAKNKRFEIVWFKDGTIAFYTKTLQDFKKRIITTTNGVYSLESFLILAEMFSFLHNDADFKKINNAGIGQHEKSKTKGRVIDFTEIKK